MKKHLSFQWTVAVAFVLVTLSASSQTEIEGCTYFYACNYNPEATVHIDICEWQSCLGCTYFGAANYNDEALIFDGSCILDFSPYAANGDLNDDGIINFGDLMPFLGMFGATCDWTVTPDECPTWEPSTDNCTSIYACNYNPEATIDDGSCVFEGCGGCTWPCADNYDPCARWEDETCQFLLSSNGCIPIGQSACNADFNHNGSIETGDLLILLSLYGSLLI
ncbi:MAG: hypothetical protein KDC12_01205 [Flavobacteriales bacterium]|nr:hypothetical protein [Flavobacteriales bacterium]